MDMIELLRYAQARSASDLHLIAGIPPMMRISGDIVVTDVEPLTPEDASRLILECIPPDKKAILERDMQLCYSLRVPDLGYFRIAVYYTLGVLGASIRVGMSEGGCPKRFRAPIVKEPNEARMTEKRPLETRETDLTFGLWPK